MTNFTDVGDFHRKFGLPAAGDGPPELMDREAFDYRVKFLQEELAEFVDCHQAGDIAGALDGLVDLAWVAMGTAHYMRAPYDEAWAEVVRANMAKVRAETDPNKPYRTRGAVVKPPGWVPPDIEGVLEQAREEWIRESGV